MLKRTISLPYVILKRRLNKKKRSNLLPSHIQNHGSNSFYAYCLCLLLFIHLTKKCLRPFRFSLLFLSATILFCLFLFTANNLSLVEPTNESCTYFYCRAQQPTMIRIAIFPKYLDQRCINPIELKIMKRIKKKTKRRKKNKNRYIIICMKKFYIINVFFICDLKT